MGQSKMDDALMWVGMSGSPCLPSHVGVSSLAGRTNNDVLSVNKDGMTQGRSQMPISSRFARSRVDCAIPMVAKRSFEFRVKLLIYEQD